ncbi:hypothetical protein XA68_13331 [Ophiocordyceps unilateralis]|uniref:Endosomal spry domain-containing protein n=1 Tax=Ophiocordyceps unilateralis TaxID=268505 RepID=A0A2A9PBV4_OPHUN|nr:hypothetical protein XA68_13331 [Ophiocordyceps unilateralis]
MAPVTGAGTPGWDMLFPRTEGAGLYGRDDGDKSGGNKPGHGVLDPHDINNAGFFVLFALIGLGLVITGIWFFFWARNGGMHFKATDWDDYKSTVLRRKSANGTLLSGATPSTQLGGGSVYKDVEDQAATETVSGITAGASDVVAREKRKQKQKRRDEERKKKKKKEEEEKTKEKKQEGGDGGRRVRGEDGVVEDEMAEKAAQKELRSYRHEKPARVGGLNRQADGVEWDGAGTTTTNTNTNNSESASQRTRIQGGIRKVYSTTTSSAASDRVRAEARRLREESRHGRRDLRDSALSESLLEESSSTVGTKSYHHPMPELRERERRRREREERRERRGGGYRREEEG